MSAAPANIVAVGDLMLGDSPITVGYGLRSRYDENLTPVLASVSLALRGADLALGNLEAVLAPGPLPRDRSTAQMRGHPTYAQVLKSAGFDVLNVANNHADQHGAEAFWGTIASLERQGIDCCGIRGRNGWHSRPVLRQVGELHIGILGYSLRPPQYGDENPPYAQGPIEPLLRDVETLAQRCHHVVVQLHWGEEFVTRLSRSEADVASALTEAGAAAVFGHHPHVVRPIEWTRKGMVAYSLGNCVSDMIWQRQLREGLIVQCRIGTRGLEAVLARRTWIRRSYVTTLRGDWVAVSPEKPVPLPDDEYATAAARALRRQRLASYSHAVRNIWRTPPRIFASLVWSTLRNKVDAILSTH